MAQRITAPGTLYWLWRLPDPRAMPFGPFVDRNQLATWLVLAITVVAGAWLAELHERQPPGRADWRRVASAATRGTSPGLIACLTIMLATLAATLSRSGFAGVIVATAFLVTAGRARGTPRILAVVGAAGLLIGLAAFVNGEGLASRLTDTLSSTATGRLDIWRDTARIARDFPLFGTGGGTFADVMLLYQRTNVDVLFNHAHNEYLQVLTEGGLVLLLTVLAGAVGLAILAAARLATDGEDDRWMRIGACAALTGIATQSIWETGLRAPANLLLAATVAGLAVSRPRFRRHHRDVQ
jgi:O-antigen ligase